MNCLGIYHCSPSYSIFLNHTPPRIFPLSSHTTNRSAASPLAQRYILSPNIHNYVASYGQTPEKPLLLQLKKISHKLAQALKNVMLQKLDLCTDNEKNKTAVKNLVHNLRTLKTPQNEDSKYNTIWKKCVFELEKVYKRSITDQLNKTLKENDKQFALNQAFSADLEIRLKPRRDRFIDRLPH